MVNRLINQTMKNLCVFLFAFLLSVRAFAADDTFRTQDEILNTATGDTQCATAVFANALIENANAVSEYDDEQTVQQWIYNVFADPAVLTRVLNCPEIIALADDESIRFMPIQYNFPNGRQIVINYETQPKILKQRINLASKRDIEALNDPNPKIGALDDDSIWTNTDPAWYAIMVVQHGALDNFAGPDKNNTISMKYINDNISALYPRGARCTDKSALAKDENLINLATKKTVGIGEKDDNDYYVAGDVSLQWISYAEIGLDVVLTVVTFGGGQVITGVTKAARASKTFKNLARVIHGMNYSTDTINRLKTYRRIKKELDAIDRATDGVKYADKINELQKVERELRQMDNITDAAKYANRVDELEDMSRAVQSYMKLENDLAKNKRTVERIKKYQKLEKELNAMGDAKNTAQYAEKAQDFNKIKRELTELDKLPDATKYTDDLARLEQDAAKISENMGDAIKNDKNIAEYARAKKSMSEISEYAKAYKNFKNAKAGNVATRTLRFLKAANTGNKTIDRGAKVARASMKSGRVRDWLFQTTLKNIGVLGRLESTGGLIYAALKFAGEMYDWTETSTGDFTNGIDFKPLLLLSADDIPDQENVVNYGMWLMWAGDSVNPADDDAAYLQSFDFASKFYEDLSETMEEKNNHACDVDIYIVRPVIRNPGTDNPELYYLIMNDKPWTTSTSK